MIMLRIITYLMSQFEPNTITKIWLNSCMDLYSHIKSKIFSWHLWDRAQLPSPIRQDLPINRPTMLWVIHKVKHTFESTSLLWFRTPWALWDLNSHQPGSLHAWYTPCISEPETAWPSRIAPSRFTPTRFAPIIFAPMRFESNTFTPIRFNMSPQTPKMMGHRYSIATRQDWKSYGAHKNP